MKTLYTFLCFLMTLTVFSQVEFLVEIDVETGDWVKIDSLENVDWISVSNASFDPVNKQFIFVGSDPSFDFQLFSVDIDDDPDPTEMEIASSPYWPDVDVGDNMHSIETDQVTGISYALHWDASEEKEYVVSTNRETGSYELVCEVEDILYVTIGGTYNSDTQVYSFRGKTATDPWALYSVDVNTGTVLSNPEFPVLEDELDNINFIQYNSVGELFGLHWDNSEEKEYFVSIDPSTGVHEIIVEIPGVQLITGGGHFDELNNRYTFLGKGFLDEMLQLITLDAATGEVLSDPDFPILEDDADNVIELQYDNSTGILYGLHWDADLACPESYAEISVSDCESYVSPSGSYEWAESGVYADTLTNLAGCDSIITINLTINTIDTTVTIGLDDLTSNQEDAIYQWVDCNQLMAAVIGATEQVFTAEESGSYAVIINKGGCIDTSECFDFCLNTYHEIAVAACDAYSSPSGIYEWTETGVFVDTIPNIWGCDSIITVDLTMHESATSEEFINACKSYTWIDGITYISDTITNYVLTTIDGCDSTITMDLSVNTINTDVTFTDTSVSAITEAVSYQWLDCGDGYAIIPGETSETFIPIENGSYAVAITSDDCLDTSDCITFSALSDNELEINHTISIYPNPSNGQINIRTDFADSFDVKIFTITGQLVYQDDAVIDPFYQFELRENKGVYIIEMDLAGKKVYRKLILQSAN